ncbi:nudix protein [Fusarium langsethiae]|uniref:Nudix protein n=1 Tax=Fusarium langsethiae TaxID=179993 RepID=A0A0M9ERA2_FUSLA|nr:nudix protein [Fusarium langsethiae]
MAFSPSSSSPSPTSTSHKPQVHADLGKMRDLTIHSTHLADQFAINCGTVTLDLSARKVLLVSPLPAGIFTLAATGPLSQQQAQQCVLTESIAVTQKMHGDNLRIIFWYVACADSTIPPVGTKAAEGVDYETNWVDTDDANADLSHQNDQRILEETLNAVERARALVTQAVLPAQPEQSE